MMDWKPYFHISFDGGIFLFPFLRVDSWLAFGVACSLTILICWTERFVTYLINVRYTPSIMRIGGRVMLAGWKAGLYGCATFLRLIYMLVAMSFHVGLILVTVAALASGQFMIEWNDLPAHVAPDAYRSIPLQPEPSYSSPRSPRSPHSRPRARSHPYARPASDDFANSNTLYAPHPRRAQSGRPSHLVIAPDMSNYTRRGTARGLWVDVERGDPEEADEEGEGDGEGEEEQGGKWEDDSEGKSLWEAGSGPRRAEELLRR